MNPLTAAHTRRSQSLIGGHRIARLDLVENPYGPCPAALESLDSAISFSPAVLADRLKMNLHRAYGVNAESIVLFGRLDSALQAAVREFSGPVVTFPPSSLATWYEQAFESPLHLQLVRNPGRAGALDAEGASDLPWNAVALIESPSNPLGAVLRPADAVRLARACRLVVVDERFSEFAGHTLLGLAREFDNVVILRSFDAWAGLATYPCGWAVVSPRVAEALAPRLSAPEPEAMAAAVATLECSDAMKITLRLLREERSRLYRTLRKYAAFEPLPSWGPFLTARVAFGIRDDVVARLAAEGVVVHAALEEGLEDYIRFGLGTRSAMEQLHSALSLVMPAIVNDGLLGDCADADRLALGSEQLVQTKARQIE